MTDPRTHLRTLLVELENAETNGEAANLHERIGIFMEGLGLAGLDALLATEHRLELAMVRGILKRRVGKPGELAPYSMAEVHTVAAALLAAEHRLELANGTSGILYKRARKAEQENERLREMANRDRALAGQTQALSAKVLEENERLRIELAVCRGLADGYGGDFSGTDAGIKFAVIASRADAALAPQPAPPEKP